MGAAAFVIGMLAGWRSLSVGYALILGAAYVWPILVYYFAGIQPAFGGVWLAGVLGLSLGGAKTAGWSLPPAWRYPLVLTALSISLTWPIIVGREMDFSFEVLKAEHQAVTWQGILPGSEIVWISGVAAGHLVGLLWIDALVGMFRASLSAFTRVVLWPLASSAACAAAVSLYQLIADMNFMNPTVFAGLKRATGTMLDANAFGLIAAIWCGAGAWLLAERATAWARRAAVVIAFAFALAVWASGSRTALSALIATAASLALALAGQVPSRGWLRRLRRASAIGALLLAALTVAVFSDAAGPLSRLRERPHGTETPLLTELRDRGGYGTTARAIIREFPLTGGGVGSFHALVVDYSRIYTTTWLAPDNAQNWFRHQLAELGWLGASGYFIWAGVFLFFVLRTVRTRGAATSRVVAGVLAGICAACILGMPTQDPAVLVTFWTMVAWLAFSRGEDWSFVQMSRPMRWSTWLAIWVVVAAFSGLTSLAAVQRLRVPFRAASVGWPYQYGISGLDNSADDLFRWTAKRAVATVPVKGKYLVLRFRIQHPEAGARPVAVKIKLFNQTIVRELMRDHGVVTRYVRMSPRHPWIVLSFEVSHTFQAPGSDPRDLGLAVEDWSFVDVAPAHAWVVDAPTAFPPPRSPYN